MKLSFIPLNILFFFSHKRIIMTSVSEQDDTQPIELLYKVLVVGDIGTGKTSIIKRYVHDIFSQHYKSTIGVDFALKSINLNENTLVKIQLWDIAGQERFGNMTRVYYREAVGAFIVYDVTRVSTFEAVLKWKHDIDSKIVLPNTDTCIPVVLLANKCDLVKADFIQEQNEMKKFCEENGFIGWFETSAKDDIGIDDAANCLINTIMNYYDITPKPKARTLHLSAPLPPPSKNCC